MLTFANFMEQLSKNYEPAAVEEKWSRHWKAEQYFKSVPDSRKPFTVVIPPPNVTGVLHMGHTLNETVQDILVRKARMSGFNACWVPGSDHASIATEAKVVGMLKERGIDKNSLSRPEFLKYAYEWKEKYGGIIYSQIEKLGCSVDWSRVTFTMDDAYYKAVMKVFVDLHGKGLIYRGARMINWDPAAQTALSDEEVEYKDLQGKLYYIRYSITDEAGEEMINPLTGEKGIIIATQRPETIMGDTAVCVNPNDERYAHLKHAKAVVPLINRSIPIIFDEYVDPAFGTGALKVTPAHDINDYNLGLKHHLEVVDTLNADGTLSEAAQIYVGEDRFAARKKIIAGLSEKGFIVKEEEYATRLGYSQRTGVVVEPRISTQWFLKMKPLAEPALKAVLEGEINIHPGDKFLATYKYWLENVKDWCISRQLWWGQQIPAWYDDKGNVVVAENETAAKKLYTAQYGEDNILTQDEDVLDTWFSSWLWPMEVFKGISDPGNRDIQYYYPTSVLVTGQDIIFFWVARMIMAGLAYNKEKPIEKAVPFRDVYFTGMVRDKQGRKMSKQLGNSPDLLKLIEDYGADAVRFGIMISSPAGNDLLFDNASLEQGKFFNNKLWNALKLVKMWEHRADVSLPANDDFATQWFESRLNEVKAEVEKLFSEFRLSEALKTIYSLIWDDFCSWYLEWVKPGFEQSISADVYSKTVAYFTELLQLLHPYMPFITEEINERLNEGKEGLCVMQCKPVGIANNEILQRGAILKADITAIRDARKKNEIKNSERISFSKNAAGEHIYRDEGMDLLLRKQTNVFFDASVYTNEDYSIDGKERIVIASSERQFYLYVDKKIDTSAQKEQLEKDLAYQKGFLAAIAKKLSNERFVQNARPEVVELERKKMADAEAKIKAIEESLAQLS
ncbi:valine--tRNA ligase [Agriterribacter sp.]|uniref:valine--tRNA ligase n=1 Tax=Agriterribacter sp. TaxID=2821509 RepID=UPI002BC7FD7E|nr:valine--tRNA ligase [Agriterribacter sp.]HRO48221.1 valine--tRNA ligase [Agriterribacter sp.]HRQ19232.1 valine--tRNA ligase [Agriterribacter sp.]